MELSKALDRVRKLTALAEHPSTPPAEATLAREQADALMLHYAIEQAMLNDARPEAERMKPGSLIVALSGQNDIASYVASLASAIARHCRCIVRSFDSYDRDERVWKATAYGYEGDLAYFEVLYTTVRLHMLGVLRPQFEADRSLEDNCYAMHEAGYNWLEMAEIDGWKKFRDMGFEARADVRERHDDYDIKVPYYHRQRDELAPATKVGGYYKRAYLKACTAKGEDPTKISASSSKYYRNDAVSGYVSRISARLVEARLAAQREAGESGTLVLAGQADRLEDFYREDNESVFTRCPHCKKLSNDPYKCDRCGETIKERPEVPDCPRCKAAKSGHCREHPGGSYSGRYRNFNESAYRTGTAHANTADLGTQRRAEGGSRKAI